jgi:hypothetical protein
VDSPDTAAASLRAKASGRARSSGEGAQRRRARGEGVRVRREGRAEDDGYRSELVPGLRAGYYLCFFGMHVLAPDIFELLEDQGRATDRPLGLSPALHALAARRRYLAFSIAGRRYDIGATYGLLFAQLALTLAGRDRDRILTQLVELLASR